MSPFASHLVHALMNTGNWWPKGGSELGGRRWHRPLASYSPVNAAIPITPRCWIQSGHAGGSPWPLTISRLIRAGCRRPEGDLVIVWRQLACRFCVSVRGYPGRGRYMEHIHKPGNCIVILHCMDLSAVTMQDEYDDKSTTKLWEAKKTKYKELESKYRWKLNELGVCIVVTVVVVVVVRVVMLPGKIRTESGKPGEIVISVANQEKANLIVIGSRCLSRIQRTIMGSVSDYVLHNAKCSVIICRQSDNSPLEKQGSVKA
ncbi:hypothetical protein LSH36_1g00002 [Paralvinella palmiformis]|uniref:UspA domain-containing protein n=1 Tax=Paralvinella palmiformis TaxID=53620 RepID=A0AAD9KG26_9ANNE|nr:hypothetical protein LSH36_1g00002 [Paralvinella palmiformis]